MGGKARRSDLLLLVASQFVWGSGWTAIKQAQQQMGPVTLNVWSLAISVLTLLPFYLREPKASPSSSRPGRNVVFIDYFICGVLGAGGMVLLYAWGAGRSLAANGASLSMCIPVFTAILAAIILGERMTRRRTLSLLIALPGVLIVSGIHWGEVEVLGTQAIGNLLMLGGTVANALYAVYSKKLLGYDAPISVLFWTQLGGLLACVLFLGLEHPIASVGEYTLTTWGCLLFLGVVYFTLTLIILFRILVRLEASQIMISSYLQPVFGVLTAAVLLGEKITLAMVVGGALVFASTVLATTEQS